MHEWLIVENNKFYKLQNYVSKQKHIVIIIVSNEAALCPELEYSVMLEISMCNHMVMSEGIWLFDHLIMGDELHISQLWILTCLSWIILIKNSTLSNVYSLNWLKFIFFRIFRQIPVRILFDVLFHVFRFSKVSFNALTTFIHNILKLYRWTEGCHGNFVILHVKLQINTEILCQS